MAKTNIGLVEYCKAQVGRPYWYGTCGDIAGSKLWEGKSKTYPKYYSEARRKIAQERGDWGKKVHDCSGLIKGYLMSNSPDMASTYKKSYDLSANGFFNSSSRNGEISSIPEVVGLGVWKNNHIGVYIGDGKIIEAKGFDYGVVVSDLKGSPFTHWLELPFIKYEDNITTIADPVVEVPTSSDEYYTVVKGDTLTAIAKRFNTTVKVLKGLNKIANADLIQIGQKILIPQKEEKITAPVSDIWEGKVNTVRDPLNIRSGSGTTYPVIGQLQKGSITKIKGEAVNGFYKLAEREGYVSAKFIIKT